MISQYTLISAIGEISPGIITKFILFKRGARTKFVNLSWFIFIITIKLFYIAEFQ